MSSASSIFRSDGAAVLITGPKSSQYETTDGVVTVEPERCETAEDLSSSDNDNNNNNNNNRGNKNPLLRFLESGFGAESQKKHLASEMQEMRGQSTTNTTGTTTSTVKVVAGNNNRHNDTVSGYDICKEYSYSGEEDENNYFNDSTTCNSSSSAAAAASASASHRQQQQSGDSPGENVNLTYILGRTYHPIRNYASRRDDETTLFWFTYRCDFPEIVPYNITSDAGWGCMLRSAQMLLGQALRVHYRSRDWKPPHLLARRRQDPFVRSILSWFADFPSSKMNVYSLHNMVAAGLAKYDKLPGEWYGPGTACYVLRDLVEMHDRQQTMGMTKVDRKLFRVHVSPEASVYRDSIEQLMTRDSSKARQEEERDRKEKERQPEHPLDVAWEDELVESVSSAEWDTALLLLIPLRLGLKTFNHDYVEAVAHTFSLPQSVGVLGGRPRGARWFYGALSDGSKVLGLDPHTVQNAPRKRTARVNRKTSSVVDLTDDYLRSVHTTYPEVFSLEKMDPSIALGFYCRDRSDLDHVFTSLQEFKASHPNSPELFTVSDVAPDYSANVSSAIDDMLLSSTTGSLLDADGDEGSDEDEYVLL